jgi:glycosyltransferase involved in cell wall biosynthesis
MPAAYMLADVVVSASSDPEGFGRVIIEAQAMGRPVVATDHGGARETIEPGLSGWLVPPRNPARLAAAISEALSLGESERAAFSRRAIAHVASRYSRQAMWCTTIEVMKSCLSGRSHRKRRARRRIGLGAVADASVMLSARAAPTRQDHDEKYPR